MRILYLGRKNANCATGAAQVSARNLRALKKIVGEINVFEYYFSDINIKDVLCSLFSLSSYGVSPNDERQAIKYATVVQPDMVFIDGSSNGNLLKKLSKKGFKTICFAHNIDTELARQELSSRNPIISLPKYFSIKLNERMTTKYADLLICLTSRDSKGFETIFHRSAELILPITFAERDLRENSISPINSTGYLLFVGSNFFPNVEGIAWFVEKVAPFVKYEIHVVGSCCENKLLKQIKSPSNVKFLGYVEDLDAEYKNAVGVIAPIFKGSGMKTKIIEAMSYGKAIFGTSEAFQGIDCDFQKIGGLCNSDSEFIMQINNTPHSGANPYTLSLFSTHYSDAAFEKKLEQILL